MGRTAMQFYGRDAAYRHYDESMTPLDTPPVSVVLPPATDTMTWQQQKKPGSTVKQGGRKTKGERWKPFNLTAAPDPPVVSSADNSFPQPIEDPIVRLPATSTIKAAASVPQTSDTTLSINPSPHIAHHASDAKRGQKRSHKRASRNRNRKSKQEGMAGLPKSAYVPPHLRKQAAAAASAAATNKADAPCVQNNTDPTSAQSATETTDKNHTLINDSSLVSKQLTSAPSTPPVQEHEKSRSVQSDKRVDSTQAVADDREAEHVPITDFPGWDAPKSEPKPCAPKTENPRWPRGPKPLQKKTVWPKNRDMKAVSTDSSSDGGISFRSDSNGDPDYDVKKLMDWNGDWLPAPEQWAARKGHTDRHFGRVIEDWMNGHDEYCDKPMEIDSHFTEEGCKELVPRYWVITKIESDSLGTFWARFTERAPSPVSDIDVMAEPPFWERYEDGVSPYSNGLVVPEANVDPADPENNMGGVDLLISATERVSRIEEKKFRAHARILARQRRPLRDVAPAGSAPEDRSIQPKSNVYFRPVKPADVEGIGAIYNHYVENTIYAPEFDGQNVQDIAEHADAIVEAGLPFLVAVARGNQPRGPKGYVSERIVGFIYLDDWHERSSIYRYTFKLELYVHPGYTSQNIGSCLLDKLLEMASTGYKARDGYEYKNDSDYLKTGPSRVIKTIILQVLKENGEKPEETSKFLKQFNFSCAGHITNMGFKFGKAIEVFMYRHTTTEYIDANARPLIAS